MVTAETPAHSAANDGATAVTDLDRKDANKKLAHAFVDDILVNGHMDLLADYYDGDAYLQAGKIAEHWDTIELIPPRAEWKNANGKFGF